MAFVQYFIDLPEIFQGLSDDDPNIYREVYFVHTEKILLVNCSVHTEIFGPYLLVQFWFHSVRTSKVRSESFAVWT